MRSTVLVAAVLAASFALPTAAALPATWTPTLLAVAGYVAGCTGQEVGYVTGQGEGCWGIVRATECVVRAIEAEVDLAEACPPRA